MSSRQKPERILFINHEYPPTGGGAATVTRTLVTRLHQAGYPVALLTGTITGSCSAITVEFPVFQVNSRRRSPWEGTYREFIRFFLKSIFLLCRIRKEFRPTIAFAFFSIPGGLVALVQKGLFGVPYIVSIRGADIPGFQFDKGLSLFHTILRPLIKLVLWQADQVHVNSLRLQNLTRQIISNGEIILLPNGIEPALTKIDSTYESPLKLLFVGRLSPQKNLSIVLKALAQMDTEHRAQLIFNIVGDGPERQHLEQMVSRLKITDNVRFNSWVDRQELPGIFQASDILLLPSLDEGMPNAALEAINYGCLVIGSKAAQICTAEFSVDSNWLIENGRDVQTWQTAIMRAVNNPELVKQDAELIRQLVLTKLGWEKLIPDYIKLIVGREN
ncbi:MAG: glycosyltransferase family 4 protein [Candidatus Neomarinimicrobiota bacterium]